MVDLTVRGHEIHVDDEHLDRVCPGSEAPEIRSCWEATTAEYQPVLLLELAGGLLVTGCLVDGGETPPAATISIRWADVRDLGAVERTWTLVLTPIEGPDLILRFASLGLLREVRGALSGRPAGAGSPVIEPSPTAAPAAEQATPLPVRETCTAPPRTSAHGARIRGRGRVGSPAGPALARIERRLASVETLLADLNANPGPPTA